MSRLLIYSEFENERLLYTCAEVFGRRMELEFVITQNEDDFRIYTGYRLNYSNRDLPGVRISPLGILSEENIGKDWPDYFRSNGSEILNEDPREWQ
ncbi:MAG: hypothetical protein KDB91_12325, partial [Bacteroidales bacterium]|nr:hypothetical protein [Bacteroidales bacterium]